MQQVNANEPWAVESDELLIYYLIFECQIWNNREGNQTHLEHEGNDAFAKQFLVQNWVFDLIKLHKSVAVDILLKLNLYFFVRIIVIVTTLDKVQLIIWKYFISLQHWNFAFKFLK